MNKVTIDKVILRWEVDESPDLSHIGEYTNDYSPGNIIAVGEHQGKFCENVPDDELPSLGSRYRYFTPYAGGEAPTSGHYHANAIQDFERMEGLQDGDWSIMGCVAEAELSYPIGQGSLRLERMQSGGLWGIESDSSKDYLKQVENEQLADLADHLSHFGTKITVEQLKELI